MAAQPKGLREDLLRGVRWGAILMIAALLTIAAYRVISSSPATASPSPEPEVVVSPAGPVAEELPAPIQIESAQPVEAAAENVGPVNPTPPKSPAKQPARRAKSTRESEDSVPPPPPAQKRFVAAAPAPAPAPKATAPVVVTELPEVHEAAPAPAAAAVPPSPALAPPPGDEKGSRAGRVVRSVGRIFRFGRKDEAAKEETKQQ